MPQNAALKKTTSPASVEAALCFIVPQVEKPVFQSAAYTGGDPKIFFEVENRTVKITDIRRYSRQPTMEREGFEFMASPTAVVDLNSDVAVANEYGCVSQSRS